MAITLSIYSNVYNTTKSITVDFQTFPIATLPHDVTADLDNRYFIKITNTNRDTNNLAYSPVIIESLSDLALNGQKQSAVDTANAYADIKSAIIDYIYDFVHGHTAGQYGTQVTAKAPMKFSS
jgi:hypothetical protein